MNTPNSEDCQNESLDAKLTRLICEEEGIPPEELTVSYIHEQREKRFYPTTRYDVDSDYGGYSTVGLKVFTGKELSELRRRVHKKLGLA